MPNHSKKWSNHLVIDRLTQTACQHVLSYFMNCDQEIAFISIFLFSCFSRVYGPIEYELDFFKLISLAHRCDPNGFNYRLECIRE